MSRDVVWFSIDTYSKDVHGSRVLVWDGKSIYVAWFGESHWQGDSYPGDNPLENVTHWMPLPPPPKKKKKRHSRRSTLFLGHYHNG